jgi:hypothetical protein
MTISEPKKEIEDFQTWPSAETGTFTQTAVIDYRLSFPKQGKQTSVLRFCLQQTNGSFLFSRFMFMANK